MSVPLITLKQLSLFDGINDDLLGQLAQFGLLLEKNKRELVYQKGDSLPGLFVIYEGKISTIDFTIEGREVILGHYTKNDFFGELPLIDKKPASEFAIATEKTQFILFPGHLIRPILLTNPKLAELTFQRLALQIRQQIVQRTILALNNPLQKICAQLTQLSENENIQDKQNIISINAPTHQEIALMVNLTRETVTRTLQQLKNMGIVDRQGTHLVINIQKMNVVLQNKK